MSCQTLRVRQERRRRENIKFMHKVLESDQVVAVRRKGGVECHKTYKRRSGCDGSQ